MITGLLTLAEATGATWVACARNEPERQLAAKHPDGVTVPLAQARGRLHYAIPTREQYEMYYSVIANPVLWFLQHYLWDLGNEPVIDERIHQAWTNGYVEVNRQMPYVFGKENGVHVSEVDFVIEGDDQPCAELPNSEPCEVDRVVARRIAAEVEDGSCLQIGIGGMPNAVCSLLLESGVKDLGIHTEMLTDGLGLLYRSGRVTGSRKTLDPGKVVYTFALGSLALYATANRNPHLYCHQVDYTNSPHIIMQNEKAVSINNTTQIDLQGQVASESDGHRHLSGTGGQLQFVRGAYASKGGKSFICLSSTYEKRGERRSRIVFTLTSGNIVTTPRSDVMYVVTEFGMVNLKGRSVAERAKALIGLAHPDFREDLERQACENRLIPRGVSLCLSARPAHNESSARGAAAKITATK